MAEVKVSLTKKNNTTYDITTSNGLKEVETTTQSTPNANTISYGLFENSGQVKAVDSNKEIYQMILNDDIESSDIPASILVNGNQIQEFLTDNSSYVPNGEIFNCPLKDKYSFKKNIDGFNKISTSKTLYDILLDNILTTEKYKDSMFGVERYFTNTDGVVNLVGESSSTSKTLDTAQDYPFINGNKYYCRFYAKVSSGSYRVRLTYPHYSNGTVLYNDNVNNLYNDVGTTWTKVSGFMLPHTYSNRTEYPIQLTLVNNNAVITAQIKDISIVNLTQNGLDDKTLEWCDSNIISPANEDFDNSLQKNILYGNNTYGTVKSYLQNINVTYPLLKSDSKRNQINKICEIAQLNAFVDTDGVLKFYSARPVESSTIVNNSIVIPSRKQYGKMDINLLGKTKFNNVSYTERKLNISDDEKPVYTCSVIVYNDSGTFVATDTTNVNKDFASVGISTFGTQPSGTGNMGVLLTNSLNMKLNSNIVPDLINSTCFAKLRKTFTGGLTEETTINIFPGGSITGDYFVFSVGDDGEVIFNFFINVRWASSYGTLITKQKVASFTLDVYKKTYEITEETKLYNDNDNEKTMDFYGNELLQYDTKYNNSPIQNIINSNIVSDYSNGVMSGKLTVSCGDYYTINNQLAKNWANGQIFNVGDIVRVDKDNNGNSLYIDANNNPVYWKITGRTFRYSGCPYLDLELQEVKFI